MSESILLVYQKNDNKIKDTKENIFSCKLCNKKFNQYSRLQTHNNTQKCCISTKKIFKLLNIRNHYYKYNNLIKCTLCKREFKHLSRFNTHINCNKGCITSNKVFKIIKETQRLIKEKETQRLIKEKEKENIEYINNLKAKEIANIKKAETHKTRNLRCKICFEDFNNLKSLGNHLNNKYACISSEKILSLLKDFFFSIEGGRNRDKEYCKLCGTQFDNYSELLHHLKNAYGCISNDKVLMFIDNGYMETPKKEIICNLCKKSFNTITNLIDHIENNCKAKNYKSDHILDDLMSKLKG